MRTKVTIDNSFVVQYTIKCPDNAVVYIDDRPLKEGIHYQKIENTFCFFQYLAIGTVLRVIADE